MVFEKDDYVKECTIMVAGEKVERIKDFTYLGSMFTIDGNYKGDIEEE